MTRAAACGERQHIVVQSDAEDTYKPRGERCFLTVPVWDQPRVKRPNSFGYARGRG